MQKFCFFYIAYIFLNNTDSRRALFIFLYTEMGHLLYISSIYILQLKSLGSARN